MQPDANRDMLRGGRKTTPDRCHPKDGSSEDSDGPIGPIEIPRISGSDRLPNWLLYALFSLHCLEKRFGRTPDFAGELSNDRLYYVALDACIEAIEKLSRSYYEPPADLSLLNNEEQEESRRLTSQAKRRAMESFHDAFNHHGAPGSGHLADTERVAIRHLLKKALWNIRQRAFYRLQKEGASPVQQIDIPLESFPHSVVDTYNAYSLMDKLIEAIEKFPEGDRKIISDCLNGNDSWKAKAARNGMTEWQIRDFWDRAKKSLKKILSEDNPTE